MGRYKLESFSELQANLRLGLFLYVFVRWTGAVTLGPSLHSMRKNRIRVNLLGSSRSHN